MDCVRICSTDFAFPKSNPTFPVKPWLTPALEKAASWHHTLTIPHSISSQQMQRAGRCLSYISTMHLCSSFRSQQSLATMKFSAGMPPHLLPEGGGMQHETCWSCSLKPSGLRVQLVALGEYVLQARSCTHQVSSRAHASVYETCAHETAQARPAQRTQQERSSQRPCASPSKASAGSMKETVRVVVRRGHAERASAA